MKYKKPCKTFDPHHTYRLICDKCGFGELEHPPTRDDLLDLVKRFAIASERAKDGENFYRLSEPLIKEAVNFVQRDFFAK